MISHVQFGYKKEGPIFQCCLLFAYFSVVVLSNNLACPVSSNPLAELLLSFWEMFLLYSQDYVFLPFSSREGLVIQTGPGRPL